MTNGEEQPRKRNIDERIDAIAVSLELLTHDVESLRAGISELRASTADLATSSKQDGENIRALARIAEIHERRLSAIEGDIT